MKHNDLRKGDVLLGRWQTLLVVGEAGGSGDYRVVDLESGEVYLNQTKPDLAVSGDLELLRASP